jgi:L-amino acid N-acyltransferase YncA
MSSITVRPAQPERDAAAVARVYGGFVATSAATFEEVPPGADEMAARMSRILVRHPWLVAEAGTDGVVGYAYASQMRERAGYRWSAEISAYVGAAWHGRGVGAALYGELLRILRREGIVNVYAGIALPNPASVALHERIGMERICVYAGVGFKFGRWHDVAWYGMRLGELPVAPAEPIPFGELS